MNKKVSYIYDNCYYLTQLWKNKGYNPVNELGEETVLMKDAMFLKKYVNISYELAIKWLENRVDKFDRKDCECAFNKCLFMGKKEVGLRLIEIYNRYSLVG